LAILAAYNEIALKSRYVRSSLERTLAAHIEAKLQKNGYTEARVERKFGRLVVRGAPDEAAGLVSDVFGVAFVLPAAETDSEIDSVVKLATKVAEEAIHRGESFAVRSKVVGDLPYGSRDLAVKAGAAILEVLKGKNVRVNLSKPDVTIGVEVREGEAFVYTKTVRGVGGVPYGTQGHMVSLFSGGIDSPVATWLMMKRGVAVYPLFMDQTPYVGESYLRRAEEAYEALCRYASAGAFDLYVAPMGDVMAHILKSREPRFTCILCKRAMYRIAQRFAAYKRAKGIITGESLGQVASQTTDNIFVLSNAVNIPLIRPLIGLDKVEIEVIARRIGTYGVTAHGVEGCKAVPSTPATRSRISIIEGLEEELGLAALCVDAAKKIEKRRLIRAQK